MRTYHMITKNTEEDTQEDTDEENVFQEYFRYVVDHEEIEYPDNADDTILLFSYLTEKASAVEG